ncbi:MAG TPA: hypothetical protein VFL04_00750 [Rectinemataceae bacterium]|nr:hypothetical protein [Rectinemataceae bacterium]
MLYPVYLALAIAFLFYLAIPIAGAFKARGQWRRFRSRVLELSLYPQLRYHDLALASSRRGGGPPSSRLPVGRFRLYGKVEAMVGKDRIWVRGKSVSTLIDFSRTPLFVLEAGEPRAGAIERLAWRNVSSLGEGTKILVGGSLVLEEGQPVFADDPDVPLLVVSYDREDEGLVADLIAAGRPENEYWNSATRISFALGMTLSSILLVLLIARDLFPSVRALAFLAAMTPVLGLSPPGLGFFILYRHLWRRALLFRMERDLVALPMRYFRPGRVDPAAGEARAALPGGGSYVLKRLPEGGSKHTAASVRGIRASRAGADWVLFAPEGSDDPAAETVIVAGDPVALARAADRKALIIVLAAALAFAAAVVVNYVIAFIVWRLMP